MIAQINGINLSDYHVSCSRNATDLQSVYWRTFLSQKTGLLVILLRLSLRKQKLKNGSIWRPVTHLNGHIRSVCPPKLILWTHDYIAMSPKKFFAPAASNSSFLSGLPII